MYGFPAFKNHFTTVKRDICTLHVHTASDGLEYALYVQTAGGGKRYTVHVQSSMLLAVERDKSCMSIHCKKSLTIFPSPAGMSLTKLSLAGNNFIVTGQGEFG
jgi:hypothetical protein